jgi:dolichol-phosphate mannosyltransferase
LRLVVIIPTYNEAESLPRLASALFLIPLDIRILVVDDNSPDGTGELADKLSEEHPGKMSVIHRAGKLGLRSAYLEGFKHPMAKDVDAIVQMDADYSHDPACLEAIAKRLETCQVVFGSRYVPGGSVDKRWPIWRKALSAGGNFYARTILGLPMRDITTGYRAWRASALKAMPLERIQSNGYIFLVEMAYLAHRVGYQVGEIPIYFADRRYGKSKMSLFIQLEAAFRIWEMLWNYRDLR